MSNFLQELKRRRVVKLMLLYGAFALLALGGVETVIDTYGLPIWIQRGVWYAVLLGFGATFVLGWIFDLTYEGLRRTRAPSPEGPQAGPSLAAGLVGYLVIGVTVIGVMLGGFWWARPAPLGIAVVEDARVIAVVPFRTAGEGTTYLAEGMVDLLSANLSEIRDIRTIDARAVLGAWRDMRGRGETDLESLLGLGRASGAGSVLTGSVASTGTELRINAELIAVSGAPIWSTSVAGPASDPLTLVDGLSLALLREVWSEVSPVPQPRVRANTTSNLDAVRAYLRGEAYFRRSEWGPAIQEFRRAVEADTLFALAYSRLSDAYGWSEDLASENTLFYSDRAYRLRERLPTRVRSLIAAVWLGQQNLTDYAPVDSLRAYLREYPDDVDALYSLAHRLFHMSAFFATDKDEVLVEVEKIVALDSLLTPAFIHPLQFALQTGDRVVFDRYLGLLAAGGYRLQSEMEAVGEALWVDPTQRSNALIGLVRAGSVFNPLLVVRGSFTNPLGHPTDFVAGVERSVRVVPGSFVVSFWSTRAMVLTGTGRMRAAADTARDGAVDRLTADRFLRGMPAVAGMKSAEAVEGAFGDLDPSGVEALLWLASAHIATGEVQAGLTVLDRAAAVLSERSTSPDRGVEDPMFAGLIEATYGWGALERGDTVRAIARMREGLTQANRWNGSSFNMNPFDRLGTLGIGAVTGFKLMAALASQPSTSEEGIELLENTLWVDLHYATLRHLELGRARDRAGDRAGALEAYRQFVRLMNGADPGLPIEEEIEEARAAVERLGG